MALWVVFPNIGFIHVLLKRNMKLQEITKLDDFFTSCCFKAMTSIQCGLKRMANEDGNIDEQNYMMGLAGMIGVEIGPTDYLLGGELRKQITSSNKAVQDLIARLRKSNDGYKLNVTVKPDYVIHYSVKRDVLSEETQKLVIEAKTTNNLDQDAFCWDLYKLMSYVNELSFQTAVYIILNSDKKRIDTLLTGYKRQGLPVINVPSGRLLFFIQENIDSMPKAYSLDCSVD